MTGPSSGTPPVFTGDAPGADTASAAAGLPPGAADTAWSVPGVSLPQPAPGSPLEAAADCAQRLRARLREAVLGRDEVIDLVIVALLADGHVLLEDYPGSGKTTLAKALGASLGEGEDGLPAFSRVQFTPDLLPSDVLGVMIFEPELSRFRFRPGPIFTHILLADEINRTSPKVQAAMLEAMAEKQVTVDDRSRRLHELFFVVATQNPLDLVGTYPLPLSQLDRFLFKVRMSHIERAAELAVLQTWQKRLAPPTSQQPQLGVAEVVHARAALRAGVYVAPEVQECLVDMARGIRSSRKILQGTSTRSLVQAIPALQARALLCGRDFVSSDDLATLAPYLFPHRVEVAPGVEDAQAAVLEACAPALDGLARKTRRV